MIKNLIIIILTLMFLSCCKQKKTNDIKTITSIRQIDVLFAKGLIEKSHAVACKDLIFEMNACNLEDTIINDKTILYCIERQIELLKTDDNYFTIDTRIECKITYYSGKITYLCLGSFGQTCYNEILVKDNLMLNFLIKWYSGYYSFINPKNRLFFPEYKPFQYWFNELDDTYLIDTLSPPPIYNSN